jgi:uncharacterized protein
VADTDVRTAKERVPAIEGWFTLDPDTPRLIGSRCARCGRVYFPARRWVCAGADCDGDESEPAELSRTGRVWSVTDSRYQPPPPYIVPGAEFTPFAVAAVELDDERMVVLGQLADGLGADDIEVGARVELVIDVLYEDDDHEYLVWKWRPIDGGGAA